MSNACRRNGVDGDVRRAMNRSLCFALWTVLAVILLVAATAKVRAQELPVYDQDARLTATLDDGDPYEAELMIAQPISGRDWLSTGACWILDDADRSKRHTETQETRTENTVTVVNPETGEETVETTVTVTPVTTEVVEPGDEWDGVGAYATTPIWGFSGEYVSLQIPVGLVMPAEDVQTCWLAAGLSATFMGAETENWTFAKWQVGGLVILDEDLMLALTAGMVF